MTWGTRPTKFGATIREDLVEKQDKIVLFIHRGLVLKSPVKDGRYRGNHIISINREVNNPREFKSKSPQPAISKGLRELARGSKITFKAVHLQNNLPYARKLEDGSSTQARLGVYGVTFQSAAARFGF